MIFCFLRRHLKTKHPDNYKQYLTCKSTALLSKEFRVFFAPLHPQTSWRYMNLLAYLLLVCWFTVLVLVLSVTVLVLGLYDSVFVLSLTVLVLALTILLPSLCPGHYSVWCSLHHAQNDGKSDIKTLLGSPDLRPAKLFTCQVSAWTVRHWTGISWTIISWEMQQEGERLGLSVGGIKVCVKAWG